MSPHCAVLFLSGHQGAEMGREQWSWLHQRMHGELAGAVVRDSAAAVQQVGGPGGYVVGLACSSSVLAQARGEHSPQLPC